MKSAVVFAALLASSTFSEETKKPSPKDEGSSYVVLTKNETSVEAFEARYPELAGRWGEIARFNLLRAGHPIEVPEALLRSDGVLARIATFYGEAEVRRSFDDRFVPVVENLLIREGDEIRTWREAGVRLVFSDGNYVFLKSHTRAEVTSLGGNLAAADDAPRLRLTLKEGSLWSEIEHEIRGRYEIRTPTASTIIRGTTFRVKVEPSEATRVEVLEGRVDVETGENRLSVNSQEGVLAESADRVPTTATLPGPPELSTPLPEEVLARDRFEQIFRWTPVTEAEAYAFELARDESFFDLVAERRVGPESSVQISTLESGTYFWRVSSISSSGFQGAPAPHRYFVFVQRRP